MRLFKGLVLCGALWMAMLGVEHSAQAQAINVVLTPMDGQVMMNIRVKRRVWRRMSMRGGRFMVRVWIRTPTGWQQRRIFPMMRRKFARSIPLARFCNPGEYGKKRLAVQVGGIRDGLWFNRFTRTPQQAFIALQQDITTLRCGSMPIDFPPGSPPAGANTSDDDMPAPSGSPVPPPSGQEPPPSGQELPPPVVVVQPPPVPQISVVPESQARSFAAALSNQSFDDARMRMLGSWLAGLRSRNEVLTWRSIRRFIRVFSFDKSKIDAARNLSRYALRPMRAAQVGAIVRVFSFDSSKLQVVGYFCQGLVDRGNTYIIANEFSFQGSKDRVMQICN
ncbi:DUF4476 domain-containing protein [Myxococcota bacterium]|nr:DUF4476 domain-containing protein [Myxococcota bacterium]